MSIGSGYDKVCKGCVHWRPTSESSGSGLHCCHCLLDTGKRNGMNKTVTRCSRYRRKVNGEKP